MKIRLVLLTAVAAIAFAQGPGFGRRMMGGPGEPGAGPAASYDNVKAYLNLTDAQITSLQAIQTQARTNGQQTRADIQTKQQALQTLLKQTSPDPTAVGKALLDLEAARAKLHTANSSLVDQAVAVLTADQKTKLQTLAAAEALQPQIHEATMLFLLTPPAPPAGAMGPLGMGPRMMGMGRMGSFR